MEIKDIFSMIQGEIDKGTIKTEEDLNAFIGKMMTQYNNDPRDDAEGLSPLLLHQLLGLLFKPGTIMTLNPDIPDELALTAPFVKMCMHILNAIPDDKPLKLTATGALPRWLVQEVYQTGVLPEFYIEAGLQSLQKELDWNQLHLARITCEIAGLARQGKGKDKGKWILTRLGKKLRNNPPALLNLLFLTWNDRLNWGALDYYPSDTAAQLGFGFSLFLLHKYGEVLNDTDFYTQKFISAFPMALEDFNAFGDREYFFSDCYKNRTFGRSLLPFGLVDIQSSGIKFHAEYKEMVTVTPLFKAFIVVDPSVAFQSHADEPMADEFVEDELLFADEMMQLLTEKSDEAFDEPPVSTPDGFFNTPKIIKTPPDKNDPCPCGSGKQYKKCCLN